MKKLLFVLCFCLSLAACNDDSTTGTENPVTNVELPSSELIAGQPVTIAGKGFVASDQIWLKAVAAKATANNLIQATVTEATTTSIIFTVPATAVGTFEILLQRGGVKHSLGNLTFKAAAAQVKFYSFCYDADKMELAEIDINTGNVSWTGLKIPEYATNGWGYVFDETKNELVTFGNEGLYAVWIINRLNVKTREVTTLRVNVNGASNLDNIIKINNKYYAFCYNEDKKELSEIDVNTGNLTWTGLKIPEYGSNSRGYVYDETKNELVTFGSEGVNPVWVINRLNIKTGVVITLQVNVKGASNLDDIIRFNNKFYTFCYDADKMELAEIDVNTGNLIWTGLKIPEYGSNSRRCIYDETTDELICLGDNGDRDFNWVVNRLNVKTKAVVTVELKKLNGAGNLDDLIRF